MTPIEAYEQSIRKTNRVEFLKDGKIVDIRFIKDIGDARLLQYAMNWDGYNSRQVCL